MNSKTKNELTSFIVSVKKYISQKKLTIDEFLFDFKLMNPSRITQNEFIKIVQRLNQSGESFNHELIFNELSKGSTIITRQAFTSSFFKVFRIDHITLQGESIFLKTKLSKPEAHPFIDKGKKIAQAAFDRLCKDMRIRQQNLQKIFKDCDTNSSGNIDRNEFNRLLFASGIKQFQDKDTRRYLVTSIFETIKQQKISKQNFLKLFKNEIFSTSEANLPNRSVKVSKTVVMKTISLDRSPNKRIKRDVFNIGSQFNPEQKSLELSKAMSNNVPAVKFEVNKASNTQDPSLKNYPNAAKYYRLGNPPVEDLPYIEELERLLVNKKIFQDNKNPQASGVYQNAANIFQGQEYQLIEMSPEQFNSNRQNLKIGKFIEADDILQGSVGDCYFLSSIGSISADYPELISEKFLFQVNPAHYYATKFFVDGEWKIYKTDDMFSCDNQGQISYARPNNNQIWVMLLQKCFAKIFGSYSIIDGGLQSQAFFALTGAPNIYLDFEQFQQNIDELKQKLLWAEKNGFQMATAGNSKLDTLSQEQKNQIGLVSGHAYSLLSISEIDKKYFIRLRNPWGNFVWNGDWSFSSDLWTPQLRKKMNYQEEVEDGIFYMIWEDYMSYFGNATICKIKPTNVHTSLRMVNNKRKSNYIKMTVAKQGIYDIFICQQCERKYVGSDYKCSNARLIIMKENKDSKMQYITSLSTLEEQTCNLQVNLTPGNYIISAKVIWKSWNDHECFLAAYGPEKVVFQKVNRSISTQFKSDLFSSISVIKKKSAAPEDLGMKSLLGESYFSMEEGIGYFKTKNRSKTAVTIQTTFTLQGLKIVKPKTNPYKVILKPGQEDILGFFVSIEGYQYSYEFTTTK